MKDYHINIFYSDEDEGYIADIPDLGACSAFGATAEEALAQVEIAKAAWLEAARAEGKPILPAIRLSHLPTDYLSTSVGLPETLVKILTPQLPSPD